MAVSPHCPNCHYPLFARTLDPRREALIGGVSFPAPNIMVADDVFQDPAALIAAAERVGGWRPSAVAQRGGTDIDPGRTNDFLFVSGQIHPELHLLEEGCAAAFHGAALTYMQRVGHLPLRSDLGYQLLRYSPGTHFAEHSDVLPGPTVYGMRQLSGVLYLNDDYDGGELRFPRQGLVYKPKAGALVLFPSNFCYPHESLPIRRGSKYAVVSWFI